MEQMNETQLALTMLDDGQNPIDNYDIVKKALTTNDNKEVELFYYMINEKIMKQLKKDKECNNRLKDFEKYIQDKLNVTKKDKVFKFTNYDDYLAWKKKLKKPYKYDARRTIFLYEVLMPVLDEGFENLFEFFNKKGENLLVSRSTSPCDECDGTLIYSQRKNKFFCHKCMNSKTKKELKSPTKTETVESVGIDFTQLPESDVYLYAFSKTLDNVIDVHIKKEKAELKKELKEKNK